MFIREITMQADDERRLAVRPEHRAYVGELFERGEIRMSGPLEGDAGAVIVYAAADLAAADALVQADPYVREGVVQELSLRQWNVTTPDK
ncbi:MAG: YciI family protein [Gaiellales bacterium]